MSLSSSHEPALIEVAVDAPIERTLTYVLPAELAADGALGKRVLVPLGRRKVTGYVVGAPETFSGNPKSLKSALAVLDPAPVISAPLLALCRFAARYYFAPLAEVIKTALPAGINVASRRIIAATAGGKLLADRLAAFPHFASSLSPTQLELLKKIAAAEAISRKELLESGGEKVSEAALKHLLEKGLVEEKDEVPGARVKEKKERGLSLAHPLTDEERAGLRRAKEKARLIAELEKSEWISVSDLRGRFKNPAGLARDLIKQGLIREVWAPISREPFSLPLELPPPPEKLMPEQATAVQAIGAALDRAAFQVFLLQGVTGSGKTEVYLRVIEQALAMSRDAVMLVPEIALTPQLLARFQQRFPRELIAALHSGLSAGERRDEWERIRRGEARIVVGARSAVFAPVTRLGVIVVDEEQDSAYKQDHGFMYNARDLAVLRAKEEQAVAVLGSATPSLESAHRSRQAGGYTLLTLCCRVDSRPLPQVELVDLRELQAMSETSAGPESKVRDRDRLPASGLISEPLCQALAQTLDRREQAILFLNRRGIASFILCFDCGERSLCPNCAVPLVYHRAATAQKVDRFCDRIHGAPGAHGYLLCHYCGAHAPVPEVCPRCRGVRLKQFGVGTEELESAVKELFPKARVLRMDSDVMTGREDYFRFVDRLFRREVDILVGTQMVAKGHDLPGVTLVGVLLADLALNQPDFRAGEHAFQLLTQVAGRAGRGEIPGRVIVQTFAPEHYAIQAGLAQDFENFYAQELPLREALWYPPSARLANLRFSGLDPQAVRSAAQAAAAIAIRKAKSKTYAGHVKILGPAAAPLYKLRGKARWMMLVKADTPQNLTGFLDSLTQALAPKIPSSIRLELDRDPMSML